MTVSDRARETNIAFDCLAAALEHYCHQFQYTRRGLRAENQWTYENDFLRLTRAICEERLKFAWHLWKLGSRLGENGQTFRRLSSTRVGILLKDIKYLLKLMRLPNDEVIPRHKHLHGCCFTYLQSVAINDEKKLSASTGLGLGLRKNCVRFTTQ